MFSFSYWLRLSLLSLFLVNIGGVFADCQSYGVDYLDGESYFIDTESQDYFSFVNKFSGCVDQDTVTPILVAPSKDEYFCSDITTLPNDVDKISTCDVAGNEVRKADMFSGTWTIIILGLTFAWERDFEIIAGPQIKTTVTPTSQVTFNLTTQSTITENTVSVQTIESTLSAPTVTIPSGKAPTLTVTPSTETITSTLSLIRTVKEPKFALTEVVATVKPACSQPDWDPRPDRRSTYRPTKLDLIPKIPILSDLLPGHILADRAIDAPTITVTASPVIQTLTSTITGPPTTITVSKISTTTRVITPSPVTIVSGKAQSTVTAPTPKRTSYTLTAGVTTVETTITATKTSYVTATPASREGLCLFYEIPLFAGIFGS
ncbi:hypothetical protein FQN54_004235 [Arachnomyces sp. PD_36]|nr:hypothetical protein FQN54_004235 [Arachnomyces sp. PD_36]